MSNQSGPDDDQQTLASAGPLDVTPERAVEMAGRHYQQRQFAAAERICRQVIDARPEFALAHNVLGVTLAALGRRDEAIASLRRSTDLEPRAANFHANLGEILRQSGRLDEACAALEQAVAADPRNAQALNNLGIVALDLGRYEEAAALYRRAIAINSQVPEAHNNLANALRKMGDFDGALTAYDETLRLRGDYAEAHANRGGLLREMKRDGEAEAALRRAIEFNPMHVDAYRQLALLLGASARGDEALALINQALRFAPAHPPLLIIAAVIHLHRGEMAAAENAAKMALEGAPGSPEALTVLGQVYHDTDRYEAAIEALQQAVDNGASVAETFNFLGVALKSVGRFDEARQRILEALTKPHPMAVSYFNLSDLVDFSTAEGRPLVERMEAELARAEDLESEELVPLHFAYGKALDDLGRHDEAFDHYMVGGRAKRRTIDYREPETSRYFDGIRRAFPAEIFRNRPFEGLDGEQLIFIVGMPRSGSTLVEQIMASHRDIAGAGEVKHLTRALAKLRQERPALPQFPAMMPNLGEAEFRTIGEHYLAAIGPTLGEASRVTDKLLTNYFFVGLINLLFPKAKIIHTVRDPVDTCLSAFSKFFRDDLPYSYDLGELGRFYAHYCRLMEHWRSVLPANVMTDVRYEALVADTEGEARRLVDFVGLDWDERCLDFHTSMRPVRTASVAQVRKPIYTSSIQRSARYGDRLQPLIDALGGTGPGTERRT